MNRIDQKFSSLKNSGQKAFVAYITAGYPSMAKTKDLVFALERAGVDMIELGIPFSDPMADGSTIQQSSKAALEKGAKLQDIFRLAKAIRQQSQIPLLFMSYYNPIFHYGPKEFVEKSASCGIDGLIIPDLPPEEARDLIKAARSKNMSTVFFVAPTTTDERIKSNAKVSTGFIYYVALTGVTGSKQAESAAVTKKIEHAKRFTKTPICAGFGISNPEQAKAISKMADGIIVGSAIIKKIQEHEQDKNMVLSVEKYVHSLVKAIR